MEQFGAKARVITHLMRKVKECLASKEAIVRRSAQEHVDTFNALMIPRCYMYVDHNELIHVVMIEKGLSNKDEETGLPRGTFTAIQGFSNLKHTFVPNGVAHSADVIWNFDSMTGVWTILKDRTGEFEKYCPIKLGGIPERIARTLSV